jgi:nucleoside 2-deoxyribosyltransferase
MQQHYVYLAGPIKGLSYAGATDWREHVANRLFNNPRIQTLSPMRYKAILETTKVLPDSSENEAPLLSDKGVTTRDRWDVMRSDLVLMNLAGAKAVSIGTMIEVGWADAFRKPIVAVMTPDDIHWHGMVRQCAGFIVPTLNEAIDIVNALL